MIRVDNRIAQADGKKKGLSSLPFFGEREYCPGGREKEGLLNFQESSYQSMAQADGDLSATESFRIFV